MCREANKVLRKPATSPWRKQALTRLADHGVGKQLTSKWRQSPANPGLRQRKWTSLIWKALSFKQEGSGIVLWHLHHLPTPWECYVGIRKCTNMMQPLVTHSNLKIMRKINTKFNPRMNRHTNHRVSLVLLSVFASHIELLPSARRSGTPPVSVLAFLSETVCVLRLFLFFSFSYPALWNSPVLL